MDVMNRFLKTENNFLVRRLIWLVARTMGVDFLSKKQTEAFLTPFRVKAAPENSVLLPTVQNCADDTGPVFTQSEAVTHPAYVWQYERGTEKAFQLPYGSVLIENKVLCTNFGNHHVLPNLSNWRRRKAHRATVLIAPWSHYLDGILFGGYYDFVMLVAAKIARIKDAVPPGVFAESVVSYPLFDTAYEREFLALLGFAPTHIVDSRTTDVTFGRCLLANDGHWFYPNVADIQSLQRLVNQTLKPVQTPRKRIYVSRAGRRRILNEDALIALLTKYSFDIIEDKPRTVSEQVAIYKNASFVLGPHGASFTNIIWCEPDTHLFELFSADYAPAHFLYVARLMGMPYSACRFPSVKNEKQPAITADILVSIPDIERCLDKLLATEPFIRNE